MPRYFIDTTNGEDRLHDHEGEDFANAEAARRSAIASLPALADAPFSDGEARSFSAIVRGECGTTLYVANLTFHGQWTGCADERQPGPINLTNELMGTTARS